MFLFLVLILFEPNYNFYQTDILLFVKFPFLILFYILKMDLLFVIVGMELIFLLCKILYSFQK